MVTPDSETYRLLYCDDDGRPIGLDEVQYLEPPQPRRNAALRALLTDEDPTARFHSMLILVSWADSLGLDAAKRYLLSDGNSDDYSSPHRLHGRDLSYDELAEALAKAVSLNGASGPEINELARLLLEVFSTEFFEHGLVRLLTAMADPALADQILEAIRAAQGQGRVREASNLLEGLAASQPDQALEAFGLFTTNGGFLPEAEPGIAHALGWINTPAALEQLLRMSQSGSPGTQTAAEAALRRRRRGPGAT